MISALIGVALASSPCPELVTALPPSSLYEQGDPRLQADGLIVALKASRRLMRFDGGRLVDGACWAMGLAMDYPAGPKRVQGDLKTPEGWYRTSDKPWSSYYGAIAIHYPNENDAALGRRSGRITAAQQRDIEAALRAGDKPPQNTPLGGEILIHGGGAETDWTLGCLALENDAIDTLRNSLPRKQVTTVLILP
jgi:murein L,D-transpeptidase YafK